MKESILLIPTLFLFPLGHPTPTYASLAGMHNSLKRRLLRLVEIVALFMKDSFPAKCGLLSSHKICSLK
jgi:hypothetical protein